MCVPGCDRAPADLGEALAMAHAAFDYLNQAGSADLGTQAQAGCLVGLEHLAAKHAAARARVLSAFAAAKGNEADGQYSVKAWLRHFTKVTRGAAGAATAQARRLSRHPEVADALARGAVSVSWAREICDWTSKLPEQHQRGADAILLAAAAAGADLEGLARLAAEIYQRVGPDGGDGDAAGALRDRFVRLGVTFGGAGRLEGDLTPDAAAAVGAVLDALGGKAGPEDARTLRQRRHDALAEACRRLIAAGLLPGRAGGDTRAEVVIGLRELRGMPGAAAAEDTWVARTAGETTLTGPAAAAAACDATLTPVVVGHVNAAALDHLTDAFLAAPGSAAQGLHAAGSHAQGPRAQGIGGSPPPVGLPPPAGLLPAGLPSSAGPARARLRATLLRWAIEVLSGPRGLAADLRTSLLDGPLGRKSLPLDVGEASSDVSAHLRRAVTLRDGHCVFPGCDQPPQACQVHHVIPRCRGGPTALPNLALVCAFHHLIVIHSWGWTLELDPDGSVTATSPDGRILRSHGPPAAA